MFNFNSSTDGAKNIKDHHDIAPSLIVLKNQSKFDIFFLALGAYLLLPFISGWLHFIALFVAVE